MCFNKLCTKAMQFSHLPVPEPSSRTAMSCHWPKGGQRSSHSSRTKALCQTTNPTFSSLSVGAPSSCSRLPAAEQTCSDFHQDSCFPARPYADLARLVRRLQAAVHGHSWQLCSRMLRSASGYPEHLQVPPEFASGCRLPLAFWSWITWIANPPSCTCRVGRL